VAVSARTAWWSGSIQRNTDTAATRRQSTGRTAGVDADSPRRGFRTRSVTDCAAVARGAADRTPRACCCRFPMREPGSLPTPAPASSPTPEPVAAPTMAPQPDADRIGADPIDDRPCAAQLERDRFADLPSVSVARPQRTVARRTRRRRGRGVSQVYPWLGWHRKTTGAIVRHCLARRGRPAYLPGPMSLTAILKAGLVFESTAAAPFTTCTSPSDTVDSVVVAALKMAIVTLVNGSS